MHNSQTSSRKLFREAYQILDGFNRRLAGLTAKEIVFNRCVFEEICMEQADDILRRASRRKVTVQATLRELWDACADVLPSPVWDFGCEITDETALEPGMAVVCELNGRWYRAKIVTLEEDGRVKVHFEGWDDAWDQIVPKSRLFHPADPFDSDDTIL